MKLINEWNDHAAFGLKMGEIYRIAEEGTFRVDRPSKGRHVLLSVYAIGELSK